MKQKFNHLTIRRRHRRVVLPISFSSTEELFHVNGVPFHFRRRLSSKNQNRKNIVIILKKSLYLLFIKITLLNESNSEIILMPCILITLP